MKFTFLCEKVSLNQLRYFYEQVNAYFLDKRAALMKNFFIRKHKTNV